MNKNEIIARDILKVVGSKDNIVFATHCMTRLRLNLKDKSLPDKEAIKNIDGVLGLAEAGGQLQIVIGQNVSKVYTEFCRMAELEVEKAIDENLDEKKQKLTPKTIGNNILNYLAGSLTPFIPIMLSAGLFKAIISVIGPDFLNLVTAESDVYILLDFVYNAAFYFLPIFLGYTAAKKIGVTPVLGMFMGAILISPTLLEIVNSGASFTVFGIPTATYDYTQSVLPIILSVWIMKYVEHFFKKYIPDTLSAIFTPFLTMLVMLPLSLCLLAPAGYVIGEYISNGLITFGNVGGFIALAVIAALWEYLVMSGMHTVLILTAITIIMTEGSESMILVAGNCATWACYGMAFGIFLMLKDKKEKALGLGSFISAIVGGVTEPALYGFALRYKTSFIGLSIGAFIGGAYMGITHVALYSMSASNFLGLIGFAGGSMANLVNGIIGSMLCFVVSALITFILGKKSLTKTAVTPIAA